MRPFSSFAHEELRLNRIEVFTDGVSAIMVTFLVVDLKVPALHFQRSAIELASRLPELLAQFLSWMITFVIVCKLWLNRHHIISLACHANYSLARISHEEIEKGCRFVA